MVSTRGIKLKFFENERVLCYEPDPTKAKVLYDSKVLDVVIHKDLKGRKSVEYLIHFQGWNSSWDRCVSEEYVLKDTPENRQLQKDLAEKSQLQLGAYLYRREGKKHGRKTSEPIAPSSEDGSFGSPARMDTDDAQGVTSSSDDDSSGDEESVPIELTQDLRELLEQDCFLINTKNKLLKLPAEPNVVAILELYWKQYATNQICGLNVKSGARLRGPGSDKVKRRPEDVQANLTVCKEVLDGIRIYFDFVLNDLLLYKKEQGQIETTQAVFSNKTVSSTKGGSSPKYDMENFPNNNFSSNIDEHHNNDLNISNVSTNRRQTLRSSSSNKTSNESYLNGNIAQQENVTPNAKPSSSFITKSDTNKFITETMSWRLLPDNVYSQEPLPPCLAYGAVHLTRLFVRLPELLNSVGMDDYKLKTLLQHLESFIDFLSDHKDWYGESYYIDT